MLEDLCNFITFTNKFRQIERAIYATGSAYMENDVEHSFQLALFTWYVIERYKLNLDISLALKYAIIHDLQETFSGDTPTLKVTNLDEKKSKEDAARKKIVEMFPYWITFKKYSFNYENLVDEESRLVNGLDKVLPVINIILDGGKTWKREDTTLDMIKQNKRKKVSIHDVSEKIWDEIEAILTDRELELFGKLSINHK